ncbi:hypothetical protein AW736_13850 [Termitidicoccus mucosus]|uniref:Uncharacterized protein n=1 Tax=Termitidicoccus mucosus TaxID=1184151 RepID=A0A178IH62_9BACT|nr:hypothetical protein AW736_13850 [Opitutaceae bacterium TSB47]
MTAQGNAYRVALPPGTVITLPDAASENQLRSVAVNEIENRESKIENTVTLTAELQLVSPAYIAERDAAEVRYVRRIIELEALIKK